MTVEIPYDKSLQAYRLEGTDSSDWITLPALDVPGQLHILTGSGRFETTGSTRAEVNADEAIANPDDIGNQFAPVSRRLFPIPTAVRFVGAGDWSIQINQRRGRL